MTDAKLSAVNGKLTVLTGSEEQVPSTPADGMEAYLEERFVGFKGFTFNLKTNNIH